MSEGNGGVPRRVLVVCPRFAPSNAADSHRVRHSLPYFRESAGNPRCWRSSLGTAMRRTIHCPSARFPRTWVIRTRAIPQRYAARVKLGAFDLRALPYVASAATGCSRRNDSISPTSRRLRFSTLALGRLWHARFRRPFVIDLQDPWRNDYYRRPNARRVLRQGIEVRNGLGARSRSRTARDARRRARDQRVAGVSRMLMDRYPWMRQGAVHGTPVRRVGSRLRSVAA